MKILQKISLLLAFSLVANASMYEYPMLYKDTRIMGMGGANIALGGEASAIFTNPAGLSGMDPEEGIEVEAINLSLGGSGNFYDFAMDLMGNIESATSDVEGFVENMNPYRTGNYHIDFNDYTSVSLRGEKYAVSIGLLAGVDFNLLPHLSLGADGLIELHGRSVFGTIIGASYDVLPELHIGVGYKSFEMFNKAGSLNLVSMSSITDLAADPLNALNDVNMTSWDIGVIYDLDAVLDFLEVVKPSVAISYQNIGGIDMGAYYASIPQTVNLGIALQPQVPIIEDVQIAIDYIDLFNGYDAVGLDANFMKKLRLGASASVLRNFLIELTVSAGMYNAAPTFGAQLRLAILEVNFAMFTEETGAYAGQRPDQRYQLGIVIGF